MINGSEQLINKLNLSSNTVDELMVLKNSATKTKGQDTKRSARNCCK